MFWESVVTARARRAPAARGSYLRSRSRSTTLRPTSPAPSFVTQARLRNEFQYRPVDPAKNEIRVLSLNPSDGLGDPLSCTLLTVCLHGAPAFEALSYTWNYNHLSSVSLAIDVDGYVVGIRENLYKALARLRSRQTTGVLWTDALCIDQENEVELGDQVAKMREIYNKAIEVIVWLGELNAHTSEAIFLLHNLSRNLHDDQAVQEILGLPSSRRSLDSLSELVRRDYWSRACVINYMYGKGIKDLEEGRVTAQLFEIH